MSALFEHVTLTWNDTAYEIKPTMKLLNRIEESYSLSDVAASMMNGKPKLSHIAGIVGIMLRSEGAQVTDEDVYTTLHHGGPEAIQQAATAVITVSAPKVPESAKKA